MLFVLWQITVQLDIWIGVDFLFELATLLMALTIWGLYLSVGILGISILFGLSVHTLRTTILSIVGIWFITTLYSGGMPRFIELDMQAILVISIISLSTIFKYQVRKHKR